MPIKIQNNHPAIKALEKEQIVLMTKIRAESQNIRPLQLIILNLMPNKEQTELQLLRLISQTPIQVNVDFLRIKNHHHRNSDPYHLENFYKTFEEVKATKFDALIVTGAPVETLEFEEVGYWQELTRILDWAKNHVTSSLFICWGAQAALNYYYGVKKTLYDKKLFGIYPQKSYALNSWLFRGFDDEFNTPQSRFTGIELPIDMNQLVTLAKNNEIGETILMNKKENELFVLGHFEYDTTSLQEEYLRDIKKGEEIQKPENYSIDSPLNTWRSHAYLFFHNWLNQVYQETPYNIEDIH